MKIRKDNDFVLNWAINWNGIAEDFTGATDMVLTASVFGIVKTIPDESYSIIGNIVRIEFTPEICNIPGVYRIDLKYSKPSSEFVDGERRSAVDVKAFKIVETSDNADTTRNLSSTSDAVAGFALKYEDLTAEQKEELRGKGIASIQLTAEDGDVNTYTITYADGLTFDFDVRDGHSPIFTFNGTVLLIDGVPQVDLKGETGNGIASIELTSTVGLVKTYTITFTDATTKTFTVTDGAAAVVQEKGSNTSVVMSQKAVTDELVQLASETKLSLVKITTGDNIFNRKYVEPTNPLEFEKGGENRLLDSLTGAVITYTGWYLSPLIKWGDNDSAITSECRCWAQYGSDGKTMINIYFPAVAPVGSVIIDREIGASYIRVGATMSHLNVMMNFGVTLLPYEPFRNTISESEYNGSPILFNPPFQDMLLSEAYYPTSPTYNDGILDSPVAVKYSDGDSGTLTLTRNTDLFVTRIIATKVHGGETETITMSITRDADGNATSITFA